MIWIRPGEPSSNSRDRPHEDPLGELPWFHRGGEAQGTRYASSSFCRFYFVSNTALVRILDIQRQRIRVHARLLRSLACGAGAGSCRRFWWRAGASINRGSRSPSSSFSAFRSPGSSGLESIEIRFKRRPSKCSPHSSPPGHVPVFPHRARARALDRVRRSPSLCSFVRGTCRAFRFDREAVRMTSIRSRWAGSRTCTSSCWIRSRIHSFAEDVHGCRESRGGLSGNARATRSTPAARWGLSENVATMNVPGGRCSIWGGGSRNPGFFSGTAPSRLTVLLRRKRLQYFHRVFQQLFRF